MKRMLHDEVWTIIKLDDFDWILFFSCHGQAGTVKSESL